ncbi:CHAT domain-containing protein [Algoriphagus sp. 4150]|uniref:CHAT domain-containing protein n=1 Tax=Algoriphagus sp. 4150 TaxID=2817756 RepID=UPI0028554E1E|nr:CHAT domain-containing protein [Algoriphagus sp. 4150]MDR7129778.1 CHAT domain-containing protein [Algoriphagus sp. 4150]
MPVWIWTFLFLCALSAPSHAGEAMDHAVYSLTDVDRTEARQAIQKIEELVAADNMEEAAKYCRVLFEHNQFQSYTDDEEIELYLLYLKILNQSEEYENAREIADRLFEKHENSLENYPRHYRDAYYEKAYTASGLHNQKLEIECTQKALSVMENTPQLFTPNDFIQIYNDLYYYQINYDDNKGMTTTYRKHRNFFDKEKLELTSEAYAYARRVLRKMEIQEALNQGQPIRAQEILNEFLNEVSGDLNKDEIQYLNSCYSSINSYYYFAQRYPEAIEFGWKYLEFAQQTNDSWNIMLAYSKIGTSHLQMGDYMQSMHYTELSMQAFPFGKFNASLFALQIIKASCLSGLGQHQEAVQLAEETLEQILSRRLDRKATVFDFEIDEIKDLNSHNYINIFAIAGLLFVDKYKSDRNPEDLAKAEKILRTSSEMFREFYLKGEYNQTLYSLHTKNTEGLLYIATEKYASGSSDLVSILNLIEENASKHLYKNYLRKSGEDTGKEGHLSIDNTGDLMTQVQQYIGDSEQILKYYVLNGHVYRASISKSEISLEPVGNTGEVKQELLGYLQQIKDRKRTHKQYAPHLIQTLLPNDLNRKIIVISDNFLNYLPFEALYDRQSNKYMVELHEFSYSYSLAMWLLQRKGAKPLKTTSSIVFNPDYEKGVTYQGGLLSPLPYSHTEAQQIGRMLGSEIIGHKVRKQDVVSRLNDFGLYHFSMHAYMDEEDFNKSCLLFSEGEPLFFEELYHMDVPANMVVLGACNTGNGEWKNGDGIMSLSMAFSFAGTRSSVYSLWPVPDAETAEILGYFYKNLKNGYTKDKALAEAKQEFIHENPIKSHPFFWAGFIVNGDTSPLFHEAKMSWIVGAFLCAVLLGLIIVKAYKL